MPLLEIRVDPHRLEHTSDRTDGALGLVNRDRLADQFAPLGIDVSRLPAIDL
ncbi:hypothetical protein D3C76_1555300 [compost metagenome]